MSSLPLGPLPTSFTPSPSCLLSNHIWQIQTSAPPPSGSPETATLTRFELLGPLLPSADSCFPESYNPEPTAYYSPGRCPSGYVAASIGQKAIGTVTETTNVCCPPGYHAVATDTLRLSYTWGSSLLCESYNRPTEVFTVTSSPWEEQTFTTVTQGIGNAINAYGIIVRFQEGDFDDKSTVSDGSSKSSNAESSSSASSSSDAQGSGGGLSSGASIGIGVAVGVVGVCLLVGGVYLLLRARRKRKQRQVGGVEMYENKDLPEHVSTNARAQELDGRKVVPQELEGSRGR